MKRNRCLNEDAILHCQQFTDVWMIQVTVTVTILFEVLFRCSGLQIAQCNREGSCMTVESIALPLTLIKFTATGRCRTISQSKEHHYHRIRTAQPDKYPSIHVVQSFSHQQGPEERGPATKSKNVLQPWLPFNHVLRRRSPLYWNSFNELVLQSPQRR